MDFAFQIYQRMIDYLCERGVMLTGKRKAILKALSRKKVIEDLDEFWIEIRNDYRVSWCTVHIFLGQLSDFGLLEKHKIGTRGIKYTHSKSLSDEKPL